MILIGKRISDAAMLHIIKMWLKAPVSEQGKISGGKKTKKGTPQGGVISPLLANIYLNLVDSLVNDSRKVFARCGVKIVRYADDFVLMGKKIQEQCMEKLKWLLGKMELTINEEKTKLINARESAFKFLGFSFRFDDDIYGRNKKYWNIHPSDKSEKKLREKVDGYLKKHGHYSPEKLVKGLNQILRGWLNYFEIKEVSYVRVAKRDLRQYLWDKLNRYYRRKSQRKCKLYGMNAFETLVEKYGLINPYNYTSPANA